ncbi:hypothetical protein AKJ51_01470 [candidate division MSBL1 archaeon SCGC-AAA382A20]|uniref:Uncharacterized protein n=1 Tax=candidate division MSBL1 archaeon SCGC-AAA382A20 TaxID=1698280 RepID=A0A133VLV2_9EURY|nr:hypothetical protein AKJ51_01470 [candidate division MSBL1 archaeon SCGC-AAA382A20]
MKGWFGQKNRHKLSALGVKTKCEDDPIYVGGRSSIQFSEEKNPYESGKRFSTDMVNCFHTSLRKDIPYSFVLEHGGKVYELNLNLSDVPDYKIFRQEDWQPFMAYIFYTEEKIPYNFLKKERPDMKEYLQSQGFGMGDQITLEDLEDGLFDIFAYPSVSMNDELYEKEYVNKNFRMPHEDEIAIFNEEILEDAWENKRTLTDEEITKADQEYHKKRMKKIKELR